MNLMTPGSKLVLLVLAVMLGATLAPDTARAADVRFYKANKFLQTKRIKFTRKKAREPGCHNFAKSTRVYKLVPFGYNQCSVYIDKNCSADSIVGARRERDGEDSTELAEGFGWYPRSDDPRGAKVRSWSCSNEPLSRPVREIKKAPKPPKPPKPTIKPEEPEEKDIPTTEEQEPSAHKEPSADKEPSANEEPSADKEPSAEQEPPTE